MGYWGDRAKDGDAPLDYFDEFKNKRQSANAFLKNAFKECKHHDDGSDWDGGFYSLFGCATLMIENGHKVNPELLKEIYERASKIDNNFCDEDKKFYKHYVSTGLSLLKKPMKVFVEINVNAFDEEGAKKEAEEALKWVDFRTIETRKDVKVSVK